MQLTVKITEEMIRKAMEDVLTEYYVEVDGNPFATIAEIIAKQNKYRWRDLRTDPEKLPPVETEVDVVCERRFKDGRSYRVRTHGFYEDGTILENDSDWNWTDIDGEWCEEEDCYYVPEGWWEYRHYNPDDVYNNIIDDVVIAWRYIEQFEEGE